MEDSGWVQAKKEGVEEEGNTKREKEKHKKGRPTVSERRRREEVDLTQKIVINSKSWVLPNPSFKK